MLSYLQNRQTATRIGNNTSDLRLVNVGVPQGSKMGPLSFIVYINDLLKLELIGNLVLYADDAALVYAHECPLSLQNAMQHNVNLIHEWLCKNVLSLNTSKTCDVMFGRSRSVEDFQITVDGTVIDRVQKYKYLGLLVDEDLNFHAHVDHIKKQITPFISLMWRKGKYIPMAKTEAAVFCIRS